MISFKKKRNRPFHSGILLTLFFLFACATVPLTERKSFRFIPDSQLLSLSFQQYSEVLKKSKLSNDPTKAHMVRRAGERIAKASEEFLRESKMEEDIKNYKWEFNLIEDDKVANAWCMPGGKVAVYTGILPLTQDETGLAVVMGHEVAHAMAKHGNDRIGLVLMAKAGYDPREAVPFWQRMNEKGGSRPPEFLSTHPAPDTRIKDIKSHIPEAMKHYKGK